MVGVVGMWGEILGRVYPFFQEVSATTGANGGCGTVPIRCKPLWDFAESLLAVCRALAAQARTAPRGVAVAWSPYGGLLMSDRKSSVSVLPARVVVMQTDTFTKVSVEICAAGNLWLPVTAASYNIDGRTVLGLQCAGVSLKEMVFRSSGFETFESKEPLLRGADRCDTTVVPVTEVTEDSSIL